MGTVTQIEGFGTVVSGKHVSARPNAALSNKEKPSGTQASEKAGSTKYIPWGQNNDLPKKLIEDAQSSTAITPAITMASGMLYGCGVGVKKLNETPEGISHTKIAPLAFRNFYKHSQLHRCLKQIFTDWKTLGSAFAQISLNEKGDEIKLISAHKTRARMVRLGPQNERGVTTQAYINADFGRPDFDDKKTIAIDVIDTQYHPAEWLRQYIEKGGKKRHFIYPIQSVSLGAENYYPLPDWDSARKSKVVDLAKNILKMKDYYLQNMMNLKYHLEFHPDYWAMVYGKEWTGADEEEKISLIQKEVDRIDKFFSGLEGGNVFGSQMLSKIVGEDLAASVRVTEFKQVFNDGVHVADLQEAMQHQLFAIGSHSSVFGSGAKQGLSGNGSENRVVYNQRKNLGQYARDEVLQLLELWRDYNNIAGSENWEFYFKDFADIPTADQLSPAVRDTGTNENQD
jgi:hypothetical protein